MLTYNMVLAAAAQAGDVPAARKWLLGLVLYIIYIYIYTYLHIFLQLHAFRGVRTFISACMGFWQCALELDPAHPAQKSVQPHDDRPRTVGPKSPSGAHKTETSLHDQWRHSYLLRELPRKQKRT